MSGPGLLSSSSAGLLWLCRDHDELRDLAALLVDLCEDGARAPAIRSCASLLRERIEEHERDEETFLHARMLRDAEGAERGATSNEIRRVLRWHDRIDSEIATLARTIEERGPAPGNAEAARRLRRELERHFEYEERVFYPLADRLLAADEELELRDELRAALLVRVNDLARAKPDTSWRAPAAEER